MSFACRGPSIQTRVIVLVDLGHAAEAVCPVAWYWEDPRQMQAKEYRLGCLRGSSRAKEYNGSDGRSTSPEMAAAYSDSRASCFVAEVASSYTGNYQERPARANRWSAAAFHFNTPRITCFFFFFFFIVVSSVYTTSSLNNEAMNLIYTNHGWQHGLCAA